MALRYANRSVFISSPKCKIILYRDDGLAITRQTPREVEMTKKKLCKIFRELRITATANKTVVDFLDITPQSTYRSLQTI